MSIKKTVGAPKLYKCPIKTITISLPVDSIPAIKKLIEIEKRNYLVNAPGNNTTDPNLAPSPKLKKLLY